MARPPAATRRRSPKFTRDDLVGFQQRWLRPDNAKIFVVSDRPLSEVQPLLESAVRQLGAAGGGQGREELSRAAAAADGAEDPAGQPARARRSRRSSAASCCRSTRSGDIVAVRHRQRRARRQLPVAAQHGPARDQGLVLRRQRRRSRSCRNAVPTSSRRRSRPTAPAIRWPRSTADIGEFLTTKGVTAGRARARRRQQRQRSCPGEFETSGAVLGAMMRIDLLGRPDNYYETLRAANIAR